MTRFQFAASSSTPDVYYGQTENPLLASGSTTFKLLNRKLAWIPLASQDPKDANLSLAETWGRMPGAYLFLSQSLKNEADFAAGIRRLLTEPPLQNARFLWLANPNDRLDQWRVTALRVDVNGSNAVVEAATGFAFGYHEVVVAPGCAVAIDSDNGLFRISANQANAIFMTARNGAVRLDVVTGDLTISLAGDAPGQLQFPIAISKGSSAMDDLDVALRVYFSADFLGAGIPRFLRYPVFDVSQSGFSLLAALDPLAPADTSRSSFAFQPGTDVLSFYRTNLGLPISFAFPAGAAGRLVFSSRPSFLTASARDTFSLVPDGPFPVAASGNPPRAPANLMCGINGAEFIELDANSVVTFAAGQPAFLPALPNTNGAAKAAVGTRMASATTTSWAEAASTGSRLCYSAVPQGAGYYKDTDSSSRLRPYFPACAAFLPKVSEQTGASGAYPLFPYGGVQADDFTSYELVETQILSPERRERIHQINAGPEPTQAAPATAPAVVPGVTTVTPQGLIAEFSHDRATWSHLHLANTSAGLLTFQSIGDPLRSALLTNQQFLVITDPSSLQPFFAPDNIAEIEDWKFLLDPGGWSQFGTILIVKNHNHSLAELVNDVSTWTLANLFNLSTQDAQGRIQASIQVATVSLNPPDPNKPPNFDFEYFINTVVNDERWNGILFLNAKVPLTALPPDLEVLAAGIDPNRFMAHHFGINQTPVSDDNLEMKPSSLFGLIDYEDPAALETSTAQYDFRVGLLRVLFHNSTITNFSAKVALTLRQFFGAPGAQANGTGTVLLDGMYEKHGDAQAFALIQESPAAAFGIGDAVLRQVTIAQTHCSTTLNTVDNVETVFAFWGDLGFQTLQLDDGSGTSFDLFSYDRLNFSNLRLSMTYSIKDPTIRTFAFDPTAMSFDAAQSSAREGSLAMHFPVQIKSLLVSNASDPNAHPVSLGYLPLGLPLDVQALSSPSYGLEFDLNLGTLGALASSAGFGASLLVAWSPGMSPGQLFAGLKLPGLSGGTNQLSLMGVLKMTMHSVELVSAGGSFVLMLNGIALSFFGKTLPPQGTFDFYIFGDPSPHTGAGTLGWYGDFRKSPAT